MTVEQLGQHAKLIRGITFKPADKCDPDDEGAVVCMRTKNVQATLDESDLIAVPRALVKNPETMLSMGDILVSSANSWNLVGKCCQVRELQYPSTAGGFISILRPKTEELDTTYLYRWFSSEGVQRKARSFGNQTTNISNLNHKRTLELQIPLPSLAEQKRIAGILDAADALRAKRRASLAQLDSLLQSTFLYMFGNPVANPMGWEVVRFELIGTARLGKMLDKGKQTGGCQYPYLANLNVQWGKFEMTELRCMDFNEADRKEFELQSGDLLVCEGGEVGRSAIWRGERENVFFQKALHRVRLDSNRAVSEYVQYYMWFMAKNGGFRDFTNSATIAHLTGVKLKRLPVPLPPLDLQRRFATLVESVERQKARQRAHLAELDALFASLQHRAFNGEL